MLFLSTQLHAGEDVERPQDRGYAHCGRVLGVPGGFY